MRTKIRIPQHFTNSNRRRLHPPLEFRVRVVLDEGVYLLAAEPPNETLDRVGAARDSVFAPQITDFDISKLNTIMRNGGLIGVSGTQGDLIAKIYWIQHTDMRTGNLDVVRSALQVRLPLLPRHTTPFDWLVRMLDGVQCVNLIYSWLRLVRR